MSILGGLKSAVGVPFLLVLIAGCTGPPTERVEPTVTDSAGIRIVTNGRMPMPSPTLRLGRRPAFRIGWRDDEPTFERIQAGHLRDGGGAVVVDDPGTMVYVLGANGDVEARIGRKGEGPGEFESVEAVEILQGDSILVYDYMLARISVFDPDWRFARSYRWDAFGVVSHKPAAVIEPGRLVWLPEGYSPSYLSGEGRVWLQAPILIADVAAAIPDTLITRPMVESHFVSGERVTDPFGRFGNADGYRGGIVWARNDLPEIQWITADGRIRQIARWDQPPTPVDDDVWAAYAEAYSEMMSGSPERGISARAEAAIRAQKPWASETLPLFRYLTASPSGEVWASEYTYLGTDPRRFMVFDSQGRALGWVEFPDRFRLLDVTDEQALGVEVDEWGVEAVAVYAVHR